MTWSDKPSPLRQRGGSWGQFRHATGAGQAPRHRRPVMTSRGRILGIFAKQPIAGQVKTRLAADTSPAWAQRVAQAFLEDTLERVQAVDASRAIVYTPATATAFFETLATN